MNASWKTAQRHDFPANIDWGQNRDLKCTGQDETEETKRRAPECAQIPWGLTVSWAVG